MAASCLAASNRASCPDENRSQQGHAGHPRRLRDPTTFARGLADRDRFRRCHRAARRLALARRAARDHGAVRSEPGLVRTALSRLVQDGLFERTRAGKNSYYRLSPHGTRLFAAATHRIYRTQEPSWNGALDVALLTALEPKARSAAREVLAALGFGQQAPTVLLRPVTDSQPDKPQLPDLVWLTRRSPAAPTRPGPSEAAPGSSIPSPRLRPLHRYVRPRGRWPRQGTSGSRRGVSSSHPAHPRVSADHPARSRIAKALLPADWPGFAARRLCGQLYRAMLQESEKLARRARFSSRRAVARAGRGVPPTISRSLRPTLLHLLGGAIDKIHMLQFSEMSITIRYISRTNITLTRQPREDRYVHPGPQHRTPPRLSRGTGGTRTCLPASRRASMRKSASSRWTGCRVRIARR